jgi:DNA-binding response OmpR family regulator
MTRLLIIEPDELVRLTLQALAEELGHSVCAVADATSAGAAFAVGWCDIVLSDFALPDGSGFEVCHAARRLGIKCGLITGDPAVMDRLQADRILFLAKPFRSEALRRFINVVSERR